MINNKRVSFPFNTTTFERVAIQRFQRA